MAKEVQMSIKMERALRDEFIRAAARTHRPAAQIVRELMRAFISNAHTETGAEGHEPNAESIAAMEELERGEGLHAKDADDLFRQLGIPCGK